jgi:6-phosphogluconolactonase (cycloisomerase 2 family)
MSAVLPHGSAMAGPPPEERPVYVTNADSSDISTFAVDVVSGQPTLVGNTVKAGGGVRQMAFTPDARLAYASNSDDSTISAYKVGRRGALTPLPDGADTVDSGGEIPLGTVVAPNGHTLYVAHVSEDDPNGGTIAIFKIASNGELKPIGSPTATTAPHPRGLAITPDGRFLYAGHGDPDPGRRDTSVGAITAYAVNGDGTLTPIGSPIRVSRFCGDAAITPDGHRLYVVCQDFNQIFGFAIGSNGGLTSLPGSPYTVSAEFPEATTPSPDGRFVFAASPGRTTDGAVSAFSVGADGALTEVPGSPYPGGFGPVGIATLPNGRFVYSSTDFDSSEDNFGALDAPPRWCPGGRRTTARSRASCALRLAAARSR